VNLKIYVKKKGNKTVSEGDYCDKNLYHLNNTRSRHAYDTDTEKRFHNSNFLVNTILEKKLLKL
jgi:hypothetical protein